MWHPTVLQRRSIVLAFVLIVTTATALNASTTTKYDISYYDSFGGASYGVGQVTLYDWVLAPDESIWADGPDFIESFSSTFFDFPADGPITFGRSDILGAWLQTTWDSKIWALGIYTCVYDPFGSVPCPDATVPYLVGTSSQFVLLVDPASGDQVYYAIDYKLIPEPSTLVLTMAGWVGFVMALQIGGHGFKSLTGR